MSVTLEATEASSPTVVSTKLLKAAVQNALEAINNATTVPILSKLLLECDGEKLKITSTDLELRIESTVPCAGGSFKTTVAAKKFQEILKGMAGTVVLSNTPVPHGFTVSSDYGTVELYTLPADEYPPTPDKEFKADCTCVSRDLIKAINRIACFPSSEEARGAVLMGTYIEFAKDAIALTATDGYRLAHLEVPGATVSPTEGFNVIVPTRMLVAAAKGLGKNSMATLSISDRFAVIESEGKAWSARIVDGRYPNYRHVVPPKFDRKATVNAKRFLTALTSATKVASDRASMVTCAFERGPIGTPSSVTLTSQSDISGRFEGKVLLNDWFGDDLTIAFNGQYLAELISKGFPDANEIRIELLGALSAVKIISLENGTDYTVLMPLRQ